MEDGIIWDGAITWENGQIVDAGKRTEVKLPENCDVFDAEGAYTAPGLVDIHNHGCPDFWFYENPKEASRYFLKHGVTTVLPTFYHSMSKETMIKGAEKIRNESKTGAGRIMDGLYMEGPFMNLGGSFQNQIKWSGDIREQDYKDLISAFGDMVRVWAIDPDRENVENFMIYAKEKNQNVVFAHGHSSATFESIAEIKHLGVRIRTHITNADRPKGRIQGNMPGAGGDEYCLCDPDIFAELICDEVGIHVPPGRIKMIIKTKGVERVCLISDHTTCGDEKHKNNEDAGIWFGPDLNYDDEGNLAGSLMTLDNGIRNVMTHTGYGLCHAIRMASLTPAQAIGIDNKVGSIKMGKKANLVLIDDTVNVKKVILEGNIAVSDGKICIQ